MIESTEREPPQPPEGASRRPERTAGAAVIVIEYAVVVSLLIVAGVVLVRTMTQFLGNPSQYPQSLVAALDGILVVIIVLDILRTVVGLLHRSGVPVRPFVVVAILAAVRDILSASAHLTLDPHLSSSSFTHSVIELGVGVAAVLGLLLALWLLRAAGHPDD
ncbi:MAG: phosphate-starvation-inducible PsiE family protein [Mycobacteriales bacterium]